MKDQVFLATLVVHLVDRAVAISFHEVEALKNSLRYPDAWLSASSLDLRKLNPYTIPFHKRNE